MPAETPKETYLRADPRLVPSQLESPLQSNATAHWLGTNLKSALYLNFTVLNFIVDVDIAVSSVVGLRFTFPRTKWPPFRRRYFHMQFREWKVLYFDLNFPEVCF